MNSNFGGAEHVISKARSALLERRKTRRAVSSRATLFWFSTFGVGGTAKGFRNNMFSTSKMKTVVKIVFLWISANLYAEEKLMNNETANGAGCGNCRKPRCARCAQLKKPVANGVSITLGLFGTKAYGQMILGSHLLRSSGHR